MKHVITLLTIIFISLLSSPSWSETVSWDDLVERDELYYKKFTDVPFTGKVSGLPSFQEGKITRLNLWLEERGLIFEELEKTFFYSDSMNDIPLLEKVSNPVAANPDEVLEKKAIKEDWPIIYLR